MCKEFTPPAIGSRIGIYKPSILKRLRIIGKRVIGFSFSAVSIGRMLFWDKEDGYWALLIFAVFGFLGGFVLTQSGTIGAVNVSLYLVNNGVDLNSALLPFRKNKFDGGLSLFKLDGEALVLKLEGEFKNKEKIEELKFQIDAKYRDCADELLKYLNNEIQVFRAGEKD